MCQSYEDLSAPDDPRVKELHEKERLQEILGIVKGIGKVNWPNDLEQVQAFRTVLRYILAGLPEGSQQDLGIECEIIQNLASFSISTLKLVPEECFTTIVEPDLGSKAASR